MIVHKQGGRGGGDICEHGYCYNRLLYIVHKAVDGKGNTHIPILM